MPASAPFPRGALAGLVALRSPRYRPVFARLLVLAAVVALLRFVENESLRELSRGGYAGDARWWLAAFCAALALGTAVNLGRRRTGGRLLERSREDLEREVLVNLMRREEASLAALPRGEILGRLGKDLGRVVDRREVFANGVGSVLLVVANFAVLAREGFGLVPLAIATMLAALWWMHRVARRVGALDHQYGSRDDAVKARLEDLLRTASEVEERRLEDRVTRAFAATQSERRGVGLHLRRTHALVEAVHGVALLVSIVATVVVVRAFLAGSSTTLLPVIVKVLAEVFRDASSIIQARLALDQAESSARRLLEYASEEAAPPVATGGPAPGTPAAIDPFPIRLEGAACEHAGTARGPREGVGEVTAALPPGRLVAVVGGAGAGKSSLLRLLAGRAAPSRGAVLVGGRPWDSFPAEERARVLTYLAPEAPVLDAMIGENLAFGLDPACEPWTPNGADLRLLTDLGLGDVLKRLALDLPPRDVRAGSEGARRALLARGLFRARQGAFRAHLRPLVGGAVGPGHWVLERLLGGLCDRPRATGVLLGTGARPALRRLAASPLGAALAERARRVLARSESLLALETHAQFVREAPEPLDERLWDLRVACVREPRPRGRVDERFVAVALTSRLDESDDDGAALPVDGAAISPLRDALAGAWRPLDPEALNPHLSRRENLAFAAVDARNARAADEIDRALLACAEEVGLSGDLLRGGLEAPAGREGANLSVGERRAVVLARALLRRTPVVLLDEPTAGMDAAGTARVARVLDAWKAGRIVVFATSDPELAAGADDAWLLEERRLVASGPAAAVLPRWAAARPLRTGGA